MTPEALTETVAEALRSRYCVDAYGYVYEGYDEAGLYALDVLAARLRAAETALQQIADQSRNGSWMHLAREDRGIARAYLEGQPYA